MYLTGRPDFVIKNGVLHRQTKRVGFRTAELVQEPFAAKDGDHSTLDRHNHGKGTSFFFKINGVPMFIGGLPHFLPHRLKRH